jgi:hypothetical protein
MKTGGMPRVKPEPWDSFDDAAPPADGTAAASAASPDHPAAARAPGDGYILIRAEVEVARELRKLQAILMQPVLWTGAGDLAAALPAAAAAVAVAGGFGGLRDVFEPWYDAARGRYRPLRVSRRSSSGFDLVWGARVDGRMDVSWIVLSHLTPPPNRTPSNTP